MTESTWRVSWGMDVFPASEDMQILEAPDVDCFRLKFNTAEEAYLFKAEMQRYLGGLVSDLVSKGIPLKVKPF